MAQKITEIEASLPEWEFLRKLPQEIEGFKLVAGSGIDGQILNIAAYVNEEKHARLDLIYTSETFDYIAVKTIGMHTFRDERFYNRDKEMFAEAMLLYLPELIAEVGRMKKQNMGYAAKQIGFEKWDYWRKLPQKIGNYELFITPEHPVPYINGSILFLDYTDFANGNQIVFMYNTLRNELFAELKKHHLPLTTEVFNANSLAKLSELIEANLTSTLNELEL